jgi:hypothetical protein
VRNSSSSPCSVFRSARASWTTCWPRAARWADSLVRELSTLGARHEQRREGMAAAQ